jgi:hypothetical protein
MAPACGIARILNIHSEIDDVAALGFLLEFVSPRAGTKIKGYRRVIT